MNEQILVDKIKRYLRKKWGNHEYVPMCESAPIAMLKKIVSRSSLTTGKDDSKVTSP